MKTIFILFLLVFSLKCFAQDPQLFDNDWYLNNVIIDGQDNFPPNSHFYGELYIAPNILSVGHAYCEAGFSGNVVFEGITGFNLNDIGVLLPTCGEPDILEFIGKHYSIYMDNNLNPKNPFIYTITTTGNDKTLTITNPVGDQAIYGNEQLLNLDFNIASFEVYPNPVQNALFINSKNGNVNLTLKIFNMEGKLLSTRNLDSEREASIDVSKLSSGIYFLNVEDENGKTEVKKFIKE